jgi:hypothetical protein
VAQEYASSIGAVALRVTRLQSDDSLEIGPSASYVITSDLISISFSPDIEEGDEFTQKGADGNICTTYLAPDSLKRSTFELAVCNPDPELSEMIAGGTIFTQGGQTVGWAPPPVGVATTNAVAIEVWSRAIVGGKPSGSAPYWHFVFPYVILTPSGDRVLENGILANTFSGWGVGNDGFGAGPDSDNPWPFTSASPYQYARTSTAPIGTRGYVDYTA